MPGLVALLQALGFRLRRADACEPREMAPLAGGELGCRVVVSCGHSGQRCYLERALPAELCACAARAAANDSRDGFWEVTATTANTSRSSTVIETGSDLVPNISKEHALLIKGVVNHLLNLINQNEVRRESLASNSSVNRLITLHMSETSSPKPNAKRFSGYVEDMDSSTASTDKQLEPVNEFRYGSLDTLINQREDASKTPKAQPPVKVCSSPNLMQKEEQNINMQKEEESGGSNGNSTLNGSDIERIMTLLQQAVSTIKQVSDVIAVKALSDTFVKDSKKSNPQKKVTTLKTSTRLSARPPQAPVSSVASRVAKSRPTLSPHAPVTARSAMQASAAMLPKRPMPKATSAKKPSPYAHVKSTIPRPSAIVKKAEYGIQVTAPRSMS